MLLNTLRYLQGQTNEVPSHATMYEIIQNPLKLTEERDRQYLGYL